MSANAIELSNAIADRVEAAGASVVRVDARAHRGASGVIWSDDGVVVTAHHVVERDDAITVTLADGASHGATLVGRDAGTDLAVLRVDAKGLARAAWSEPDGLRVGHLVVAVARPGRTVRATLGIVNAFGDEYRTPAGGKVDRYIQSDAPRLHGFSGGALVDLQGRVLGLNTAGVLRDAGIAVPTRTVARVVGELLAHGRVPKGYFGVGAYPAQLPPAIEQKVGRKAGVVLVAIEPGSPADRAGLGLGDVLVAVDAKPVERPADLVALLEDAVDREVAVTIARGGVLQDLRVTAGRRP
jgi:S1-C subfamily serine protease